MSIFIKKKLGFSRLNKTLKKQSFQNLSVDYRVGHDGSFQTELVLSEQ